MIHDFDTAMLALRAGEVQRITDAAGSTVRIETGTVWLTPDNVRKDLVLEAGASAEIETAGLVLLQAFAPALVQVSAQMRSGERVRSGQRGRSAEWVADSAEPESAIAATVAAAGLATAGALAALQPPAWQQARAAQALVAATRRLFATPHEECPSC